MKKMRASNLALCALFAALSAILAQIMIPIGPVPISMTHISIFLAAGLLGVRYGAISQLVYVVIGAIGLPVFAGFTGGIGKLMGPTGGFIIGYVACALVTALLIGRFGKSIKMLMLSMYAGWLTTYVFGVAWYMVLTNTGLAAAMMTCVVPFLLGDIPKTILSAVLVNRLSPVIGR